MVHQKHKKGNTDLNSKYFMSVVLQGFKKNTAWER